MSFRHAIDIYGFLLKPMQNALSFAGFTNTSDVAVSDFELSGIRQLIPKKGPWEDAEQVPEPEGLGVVGDACLVDVEIF